MIGLTSRWPSGAPEFIDLMCKPERTACRNFIGGLCWLDPRPFRFPPPDKRNRSFCNPHRVSQEQVGGGGNPGYSNFFVFGQRKMVVDASYTRIRLGSACVWYGYGQ